MWHMNLRRHMLAGAATAAALMLALPATALASAGSSNEASHGATIATAHDAAGARQVKTYEYCYTVIAKIQPPKPASRVISRTCSSKHATDSVLPQGVAVSDAESPLVTFYENEDYGGASDTISGKNGPCDGNGYGLSDLSYSNTWVVNGITSYKTHSSCWAQQYWPKTTGWDPWTTPCKTFTDTWEVPNVGAACNDKLLSMYLWDNK